MLRYFYIIVCIQVCFCSVYVDNNEYEVLDRKVRCKTTKHHKSPTRSPKRSRMVQFDVQKFMRTPDGLSEDDHNNILYGYRSKKRQNRVVPANNLDFVEPLESVKEKVESPAFNTRSSPNKYQSPRHYNLHSHAFDDKNAVKLSHNQKKATSNFKLNKMVADRRIDTDPEKKCSFRNMKIPFFSRNKVTAKSKRHKKRRIFCFNCMRKTTTVAPVISKPDAPVVKTDEFNKDNANMPSSDEKSDTEVKSKVRKRAYDQLCPQCIKELILNLRKKTTKKVTANSTPHSKSETKSTTKKRTVKQKADLSDSLQDEYFDVGSERMKRNEHEDQERDRRLKELDEVEKKIENVHIAASTFTGTLVH